MRSSSSAPQNAKRTLFSSLIPDPASLIADSRLYAEPEPLSLIPGPAGTESRCEPWTTTRFGSPPLLSASTLAACRISDVVSVVDVHGHGVRSDQQVVQFFPVGEGDADDRDVEVGGAERPEEQAVTPQVGLTLVEDDHGRRARFLGVERLVVERARPPLDQARPCRVKSPTKSASSQPAFEELAVGPGGNWLSATSLTLAVTSPLPE